MTPTLLCIVKLYTEIFPELYTEIFPEKSKLPFKLMVSFFLVTNFRKKVGVSSVTKLNVTKLNVN